MIVRDDGYIALKWTINPNGKTVQIDGTNQFYVFTPRNHVVMEWVHPDHVTRLLAVRQKTCQCSGGIFKNAFQYANMIDVNVWTFNNRHADGTENYKEVENV